MPPVARRSFIEKIGLGAGAFLLAPIGQSLVNEARGQSASRKRFVVFMVGNGIHPDYNFTPPEFRRAGDTKHEWPVLDGPRAFTWPRMLRSLEPYRERMLLVDGLANVPTRGQHSHSGGYSALSCFAATRGENDNNGPPGGITIDQHVAQRIGAATFRRSVLYGVSLQSGPLETRVFASARDKPEPSFLSPSLLFQDLFGALGPPQATGGFDRRRVLVDQLRGDIRQLRAALAGPERQKLDDYVAAIEEVQKRDAIARAVVCTPPVAPSAASTMATEDRLSALHDMGTLALVCGLTNVLGVTCGAGDGHRYFPRFSRVGAGTEFESGIEGNSIGHAPKEVQGPALDLVHDFNASLLARTAAALARIKEGNGTALDNTVMLYTSDNADGHHSEKRRWPLVLLGTAGGALKTNGRFIRYPSRGATGNRSMADLFSTLATACGAPTSDFGKGGNEPVQGPLSELVA